MRHGIYTSPALLDISAERYRQITDEKWTPEHDDKHDFGEMATAAAMYALRPPTRNIIISPYSNETIVDRLWPWSREWWKPKDRRRDLVKAGALIVAEIERLDRASTLSSPEGK
jgi:hypothetical protein